MIELFHRSLSYTDRFSRLLFKYQFLVMKNFFFLPSVIIALFFACSEKESSFEMIDPLQILEFEVIDSVMVEVLPDLIILDFHPRKEQYLMKERKGGGIYLVDTAGRIIAQPELTGEGPNQVSMIWEGRFFGADQYIFKELSENMDFHVFDTDFRKVEKIPGAATGLNSIFLSFFRQTFTVWEESGERLMIGEEANAYNPADLNPEKIGADFYNKANTGFLYELDADSISYLNLYPNAWEPKKSQRWIGQSFPYLAFDTKRKIVAVLPPIGDQLFLFDLEGNQLKNERAVPLIHSDRSQSIPDPERERLLYPSFSDVKIFGEYQLVIFYTPIPEEVYSEFRAKNENYNQDPEWGKVVAQYRKPRYIVIKDGKQLGILNELPVSGNLNLGLADGSLLIKAAAGDIELDYNLFYRMRLKATQ
jgi:hypothetical protein